VVHPAASGARAAAPEPPGFGFAVMNFDFHAYGALFDGKCLAQRRLPDYDIGRLTIGQWIPEGTPLWREEALWPDP